MFQAGGGHGAGERQREVEQRHAGPDLHGQIGRGHELHALEGQLLDGNDRDDGRILLMVEMICPASGGIMFRTAWGMMIQAIRPKRGNPWPSRLPLPGIHRLYPAPNDLRDIGPFV